MDKDIKATEAEEQEGIQPDPVTEAEADPAEATEAQPDPEAAKIQSLAASFIEAEVPEALRGLVPASLSAADQIEWVMNAKQMGIFGKPEVTSDPHTKRPSTKTNNRSQSDYEKYLQTL